MSRPCDFPLLLTVSRSWWNLTVSFTRCEDGKPPRLNWEGSEEQKLHFFALCRPYSSGQRGRQAHQAWKSTFCPFSSSNVIVKFLKKGQSVVLLKYTTMPDPPRRTALRFWLSVKWEQLSIKGSMTLVIDGLRVQPPRVQNGFGRINRERTPQSTPHRELAV